MSTLSVPAAPARPRQARWTFLLHRWALIVWAALVVVSGGLLLWAAGPLADEENRGWRQAEACSRLSRCVVDMGLFNSVYGLMTTAMALLPLLVAAWAGATLTARELESGTALTAWTQGVTPVRWLAVQLALPAAVLTVGTSLLVALHRFAWGAPDDHMGNRPTWWQPFTFHANGPTIVAACLTALAVGALTGLLVRRTLPALGISVAASVLLLGGAHWLMPHLRTPVTEVGPFRDGYPGLYTGVEVAHGLVTRAGAHIPTPECRATSMDACLRLYERHGGTGFYTTFHPASHYWPLQLTTSALLLVVTALLTAASFVVLRRRTG
ncbi:ABC transporter permease [Streptomyces sp. SID1328]|uniref:ABC transporter permease n=1 Tax=Streptomyces sp. SID1328 TaxID=2690250 RepID=UPI00136CB0BB|nr:ABC transporter permease [Streptomyces sp. SID1328]MYV38125.1 ABC transporter permease [Streptomyces sp. SID1328]